MGVTAILNVSDMQQSFAWFEKQRRRKGCIRECDGRALHDLLAGAVAVNANAAEPPAIALLRRIRES
jgi:hypothetical protein